MPGPVRPHSSSQSAAILTSMILVLGGLAGWVTGVLPLAAPVLLLALVMPSAYNDPQTYIIPTTGQPSHTADVARWLQSMRKHLLRKDTWWPLQPQTGTWIGHPGGRLSVDADAFLPLLCGLAAMVLPGRLPGLMFIPVYGIVRASLLARRDPPEENPMMAAPGPPAVPTPAVGVGLWTWLASLIMSWVPRGTSEEPDDSQLGWMQDILAQATGRTSSPPAAPPRLEDLDEDLDWGDLDEAWPDDPLGEPPAPKQPGTARRRLRAPVASRLRRLHQWLQTWLDDLRQRALVGDPVHQRVAVVVFIAVSAIAAVTLAGLQPALPTAHAVHKYVPIIYNWAVWRLPYWAWIVAGAWMGVLAWSAAWAKQQAGPALYEWNRTQAEQHRWFAIWTQLGVPPADLVMDAATYRKRTHAPDTLDTYVFRAAMPAGVDVYCNPKMMPKLANALQTNNFVLYPASAADAMSGRAIAGLNSPSLFNLVLFRGSMSRFPLAEPVADKATLMFVARWAIYQAFTAQRLAPPIVYTTEVLLATHDAAIYEVELFLHPACSVQQVVKARPALRDALGVAWLSISRVNEETHTMSIALGSSPSDIPSSTALPDDVRLRLINMQWRDWFQTANVVNSVGETPVITGSTEGYQHTVQLSCQLPAAVTLTDLQGRAGALSTACNRPYLTLMPGSTPRDVQIIVGDHDPLAEIYFLTDYADRILQDPGPTPDTTFYAGIGPNGQLVRHDPESVEPHLVVAGASGGGKSTCLHSFILQMAHKNTPDQWQLWLADPKNEMQRYRDARLPHLRCMIDMSTPIGTESIYATLADMLQLLVAEMDRRYEIFQNMPNRPQKLSQARSDPTFEQYAPMPYISCIVEECADYFIRPTRTGDKELDVERTTSYGRMIFNAELIARKARGAGIYLILATQRPTKESIPMAIKGQASRIGFKCSTQLDSRIILDQAGLERINIRGQGIVKTGQGFMTFKSFLPRMPDENHPDWPNDIDDIIHQIVQRDGTADSIITRPGAILAQMGADDVAPGDTQAPDPTPFWESAAVSDKAY